MKFSVPAALSLNAGYVDTAGFLALHGLFTAHVTGNFVTLGVTLVNGASGAIAKLLALPVFCIVVLLIRLITVRMQPGRFPMLRVLLGLQFVLLAAGAMLAIRLGPFVSGDSIPALVTGLTFVTAMAVQNAAHRVYLPSSPPTTMMTGTTTQIMIDIADLLSKTSPSEKPAIRARLARFVPTLAAFAVGCSAGALFFAFRGVWCFVVPPVFVGIAVLIRDHDTAAAK